MMEAMTRMEMNIPFQSRDVGVVATSSCNNFLIIWVSNKGSLFSLPVGLDTHIYFSSNLPRPPCALCGSNLIIFYEQLFSVAGHQGSGGSENILMLLGPS